MRLMEHHRRNLNYNVRTKQKTNQVGCVFLYLGKMKLSGEATKGVGGGSMLLRKNLNFFCNILYHGKRGHITIPIITLERITCCLTSPFSLDLNFVQIRF